MPNVEACNSYKHYSAGLEMRVMPCNMLWLKLFLISDAPIYTLEARNTAEVTSLLMPMYILLPLLASGWTGGRPDRTRPRA